MYKQNFDKKAKQLKLLTSNVNNMEKIRNSFSPIANAAENYFKKVMNDGLNTFTIDRLEAAINKAISDLRTADPNADISALEEQKLLIFSGFDTEQNIKAGIIDAYYKENETMPSADFVNKMYQKRLEAFGKGGNAAGGIPNRVSRAMGTPMTGEQPMANPMATKRKDVAMETQGQGNDAYAMLRARLPQEIPDDVVKLIAYNKEAFADFASIKNQEDVTSFNQKYNVSMNIDVSTV